MPTVSAFVDELAAEFGPVTLLRAEENGLTWGTPQMEVDAVSVADMEFHAQANRSGPRVEGRQSRRTAR